MPRILTHINDTGQPMSGAEGYRQQEQKQSLPLPMHPDDAKDRVFVAILKALLRLGNKPSSPKELANAVMKYKYATLGGATPYATVSSRISQHFKRAATHNPPRTPILIKHRDEHSSRRIYYSLAIDPPSILHSPSPSPPSSDNEKEEHLTATVPCSTDDSSTSIPERSPIYPVNSPLKPPSPSLLPQRRQLRYESGNEDDDGNMYLGRKQVRRRKKSPPPPRYLLQQSRQNVHQDESESKNTSFLLEQKRLRRRYHMELLPSTTESPSVSSPSSSESSELSSCDEMFFDHPEYPQQHPTESDEPLSEWTRLSDEESDEEDYHEEMLKGDDEATDFDHRSSALMRRPSIAEVTVCGSRPLPDLASAQHQADHLSHEPEINHNNYGNDLWIMDYDHDFNSDFLPGDSTATTTTTAIATATPASFDNVASPESIPVADLDFYFDGDGSDGNKEERLSTPISGSLPSATEETTRKCLPVLEASLEHPSHHSVEIPAASSDAATATLVQFPGGHEDRHFSRPRSKSWPQYGCQSATSPIIPVQYRNKRGSLSGTHEKIEESKNYIIRKKTFGSLECYQLHTLNEMTTIKILRFIASTDGTTEHVALRTRRASDARTGKKSADQYFYLAEGYVNATQMRKAAHTTIGKGVFESTSEVDQGRTVVCVTRGPAECRGAWVPLSRARELASEYKLDDVAGVAKLLSDDPSEVSQKYKDATLSEKPISFTTGKGKLCSVKYEDDKDREMNDATNTFEQVESFLMPEIATVPLEKVFIGPKLTTNKPRIINTHTVEQKPTAATPGYDFTNSLVPLVPSTGELYVPPKGLADSLGLESLYIPKPFLSTTIPVHSVNIDPSHAHPIHTLAPTNPPMYIAVVDGVLVYVAILSLTETISTEFRVMRRIDTDYVNGTTLLAASGINNESERSMILSLEMDRRRIRKSKSGNLCGTWIPLRRAREFAVTHSIQSCLGPFLDDSLDNYFPSPLPFSLITTQRASSNIAAAANPDINSIKHPAVLASFIPYQMLLHQTLSSRQLSLEYSPKEPVLGTFECDVENPDLRSKVVIDGEYIASQMMNLRRHQQHQLTGDENTDIDTDTDSDMDEELQKMKRTRGQAMEALGDDDIVIGLTASSQRRCKRQRRKSPWPPSGPFRQLQSTINNSKFTLKKRYARPNGSKNAPRPPLRDDAPNKMLQDTKQLRVAGLPPNSTTIAHSSISSNKDRNANQSSGAQT